MENKYGILAPHGKYFACDFLAEALGARLFSNDNPGQVNCEHLFCIGYRALRTYSLSIRKRKTFKSVAAILSDTNSCIRHEWWNEFVKNVNMPVYAMPDLHDYCRVKYVPVFPTIAIPNSIKADKNKSPIVICHSPGKKGEYNWKGSNEIQSAIREISKKHPVQYRDVRGLSWESCLAEKARAHIFIDQLVYKNPNVDQSRFGGEIVYKGALAKSGIEGMLLGCCVVTGAKIADTSKYFPMPPAVFTDCDNFYDDLLRLVEDEELRTSTAKKQLEWAEKYTSPEFVVKNITRHITALDSKTAPAPKTKPIVTPDAIVVPQTTTPKAIRREARPMKLYDTWERYFTPEHPKHEYQRARFAWFAERIVGEKFLDVGCAGGLGMFLAGKNSDVKELCGIDINPESIEQAKERLQIYDKIIGLQVGCASKLPFQDDHFDCIMCGEMLEHVSDDKPVAEEMYRVIKTGGTLLVSVPDKGHLSKQHVRLYDNKSLTALLTNAGFIITEVDYLKASYNNSRYLLMKAKK